VDNRIKVLREARGLSLEALAIAAETSNQQVSLLEAGKRRLTVDWLVRLARALHCHPWEIVSTDLPHPLGARDIRLLNRFQALTESQQVALLTLLESFLSLHAVE
jgi:transcriptional regulator with XRE-family HTH domain